MKRLLETKKILEWVKDLSFSSRVLLQDLSDPNLTLNTLFHLVATTLLPLCASKTTTMTAIEGQDKEIFLHLKDIGECLGIRNRLTQCVCISERALLGHWEEEGSKLQDSFRTLFGSAVGLCASSSSSTQIDCLDRRSEESRGPILADQEDEDQDEDRGKEDQISALIQFPHLSVLIEECRTELDLSTPPKEGIRQKLFQRTLPHLLSVFEEGQIDDPDMSLVRRLLMLC